MNDYTKGELAAIGMAIIPTSLLMAVVVGVVLLVTELVIWIHGLDLHYTPPYSGPIMSGLFLSVFILIGAFLIVLGNYGDVDSDFKDG